MTFPDFLKNHRNVHGAFGLFSAFALAAAFTAQYGFGLMPCDLCLWQRVPYALVILVSLLSLYPLRSHARILLYVSGFIFTAGAVIAAHHTGVEQHWWPSILAGCSADIDMSKDILAQIQSKPAVRCDVIPWADPVIGWSMAAWNALISPILAAACLILGSKADQA